MKVVRLLGGLGNQMFQYALFLALKKAFPQEDIKVDYSLFSSYHVHNGLELERVFGIKLDQVQTSELRKLIPYTSNYTLMRIIRKLFPQPQKECREFAEYQFNDTVLTQAGDRYFSGYWQNHMYFDEVSEAIHQTYQFPTPQDAKNRDLLAQIDSNSGSVSIHVRRGDYLKAANYVGLCNLDYYAQAIKLVLQESSKRHFYIFSDDMAYCRECIHPLLVENPVTDVDWNKGEASYCDMQLMSHCHTNIIANSSFSWWAAYLKTSSGPVFSPKKWTNSKVQCQFQMPQWTLIAEESGQCND